MHQIPDTALKELAEAGSLCTECGGLHVAKMDTAIWASRIAESTDTHIPWCDCACPICEPFRRAVLRVAETAARLDTTPHIEDAL